MENPKLISISDLLKGRRPISGTTTLHPPPLPPSPPPPSFTQTPNRNSFPHTKILNSLSQPSLIIGTLSLPTNSSSHHSCFSFSDNSASLCCDALHFDFRMLRKTIHILAWNFIPFKKKGGFLEIIRWKFPECSTVTVDSFLLFSGDPCDDSYKAKHSVSGVLESVSPVSGDVSADANCGFIAMISSCDCVNFVYFCGNTVCWFPALLKYVGKVILLSGLRKKLVYVGEEDAQLMFVSSKVTCLNPLELELPRKGGYKSESELGMYVGVVRSILMQGMLVELDREVWLLLTDQLLVLPHGVRVGAVLSIRNVHILKPKFIWSRMLILGACYRTNIRIVSFSPLETGCQLLSNSQSLLRRFIESLVFAARQWVLLVIQCFRKKFSGAFSDKEILGSKHKEGLVEIYARSVLPLSVFCARHSMFLEFCRHNSCRSDGKFSYGSLNLAVPFSNFIGNCDRMLIMSLSQMKNCLGILKDQFNHLSEENKTSHQSVRRILPSKDMGISLLGNLKISAATGRLQLVDATGSIDVVIPDLPSVWDMDAIYEVINYSLVFEGKPEMSGQEWIFDDDLISCSSIFHFVKVERKTQLAVFVHFAWSDVIIRDFPILDHLSSKDGSAELDRGSFHLLWLAHKFPVQSQISRDLPVYDKCFSFAEAIVLPCDLIIAASDDPALPACVPQHGLQNSFGCSVKRCKSSPTSSWIEKGVLCCNFNQIRDISCGYPSTSLSLPIKRSADNFFGASSVQLPCTVTIRRISGQCAAVSGVLCFAQDKNCEFLQLRSLGTVLLEFNSENIMKYKLLQIGGYYIIKHCAEKCFCNSNEPNLGSKMTINLGTHLWSLSIQFTEFFLGSCVSKSSCRHHPRNELMLHRCSAKGNLDFYDVSLHVSENITDSLHLDIQALMAATTCESVDCQNTVPNLFQTQGTYFRNHLPQGNLISLIGTVVSLHYGNSMDDYSCDEAANDFHPLKFTEEKLPVCLHVLTDGHMLQIDGLLSMLDCPVGLGPGANVTFHRILDLGWQDRLRLVPVSAMTVNTVSEISSPAGYSLSHVSEDIVASCLISDLVHCEACKPRKFRCRVVAVNIVLLERNRNLDKLLSDSHSTKSIVNVPVAGFVLDDGSSLCCCWADGARAATFLRLHDEMCQVGFGSWWRSDSIGIGRGSRTSSSYTDRILKRHGRVIVKNYGSICESVCQDLQLSIGSDINLDIQDEDLLKLIILNACSSTPWCVTGHLMDLSAVNKLENCLLKEQMNVHALENVWATEVCHVNTVAEAMTLYQDLL